jgi:thiosulfate/3-mercaptopyruvate sulfurtransferase
MRHLAHTLIAVIVLSATPATAQTQPGAVPLLVSTAWLEEHLQDPKVVVLWTDQGAHDEALVAGARAVRHESVMTMQGGHGLAATEALVDVLRKAGVSNDSHVVIYGDALSSGWLFFVLDYLGHPRVSLLDGGLVKWRSEDRPIARTPVVPAPGTFTPQPSPARLVAAADVQARQTTAGTVVLDARSANEYQAGRIPGAKLLTWTDVFADPRRQVFKSQKEVAELFAAAGAGPGARAITYCQIGLRSSALYFAARYAGLDVSNYVGSWSDWTARGLPVERPR